MAVHIIDFQICARQLLLMMIFPVSYLTEAEMTMYIGFQHLCVTCASILCKLDFFFISRTCNKTKRTVKVIRYETSSKENPV